MEKKNKFPSVILFPTQTYTSDYSFKTSSTESYNVRVNSIMYINYRNFRVSLSQYRKLYMYRKGTKHNRIRFTHEHFRKEKRKERGKTKKKL